MGKHTHRERKEAKYIYINMRDQENVYAIIINPGRIYIVAAVVRAEITQKVFLSLLFSFPSNKPNGKRGSHSITERPTAVTFQGP
jgi:hypothetical protein